MEVTMHRVKKVEVGGSGVIHSSGVIRWVEFFDKDDNAITFFFDDPKEFLGMIKKAFRKFGEGNK